MAKLVEGQEPQSPRKSMVCQPTMVIVLLLAVWHDAEWKDAADICKSVFGEGFGLHACFRRMKNNTVSLQWAAFPGLHQEPPDRSIARPPC
jgi:hypothetical protein